MDAGFVTAIASILVASVAAISAYASQRSASKASTVNVQTETSASMEREAYVRARAFDTETIRRQDEEIAELRQADRDRAAENRELKTENESLRQENKDLKRQLRAVVERVQRLERRAEGDNT